jgi:hypothetical protein
MKTGEKESSFRDRLIEQLTPFVKAAAKWWGKKDKTFPVFTGSYPMEKWFPKPSAAEEFYCGALNVRFTKCSAKSPLKGLQAFPYLPTRYVNITKVKGGIRKSIARECMKGLEIDGFTVVEKTRLQMLDQSGQVLIIVPTEVYGKNLAAMGRWIYFTKGELAQLSKGYVHAVVKAKLRAAFKSYE